MKKIAVVLFNLGGPDNKKAVRPFLFNLFNDPAIIRLPQPFRCAIAQLISRRRAPVAYEIYGRLNGGSPILKNTEEQARALEKELNADARNEDYRTFIAMRYWHPFADEAARAVKIFAPDALILLPLYPQFSTVTTQSSLEDWKKAARKAGLETAAKTICCYPQEAGLIRALAAATRRAYDEAKSCGAPRVLFSAHGLPEKIVRAGDPYPTQCEMTVEALRRELALENLDSVLCYQSRVGPLKWIGPATEDEVRRAGRDRVPLVVVPVAFVSDHSETLVEIDIEYRHLAQECGVPFFAFVPAVGAAPDFIRGLARLARKAEAQEKDCVSAAFARICPPGLDCCPCEIGS